MPLMQTLINIDGKKIREINENSELINKLRDYKMSDNEYEMI